MELFQAKDTFEKEKCTLPTDLSFEFPENAESLSELTIVGFFYYFLDFKELCKLICKESIRYGLQNGREFECTPREIEVFFGVLLYMGIVHVPAYRDYFRTDEIGQLFVRNAISRDRFQEILKNLHFNNNYAEQAKTDRAWKVRTLINHFNHVYQRYAKNVSHQSVDEHMVKFKGNNHMKQYVKNKPVKWGFKMWQRCDSQTGYLYEFDLYTGRKESPELGLGESVVLSLSSSLASTYATIFADNYFSSPSLVLKLLEDGIYYTGVVKPNRVGLPNLKKDADMVRGEYEIFKCDQKPINVIKWVDNKSVHIITTDNPSTKEISVLRRIKGQAEKKSYPCPAVIKDYNSFMGGVDKHDRLTLTNSTDRRSKFRFYLRLCFDFFDQAVVNCQIAWSTLHEENKKLSSKDYRLAVSRGILSGFTSRERGAIQSPVTRQGRQGTRAEVPLTFPGTHLPIVIPRTRCIVCSRLKKDVKTFWGCTNNCCRGGFCINVKRNCFYEHHK